MESSSVAVGSSPPSPEPSLGFRRKLRSNLGLSSEGFDVRAVAVRVMILDPYPVVRLGLKQLLDGELDIVVCGEAGSLGEVIELSGPVRPDVILTDLWLPDGCALGALPEIRAVWPKARMLVVSSVSDPEAVLSTVAAGADGFLPKTVQASELIRAIRHVAMGHPVLHPTIAGAVFAVLRSNDEFLIDPKLGRLSPQEQRILGMLADGKTNPEIAQSFQVCPKTVSNYVSKILAKLGLNRRTEAAAYFVRANRLLGGRSNRMAS